MATNKILLIEDDDLVADSLARTLRINGFRCVHAPNGARAMELIRTEEFDAVVSDLSLPDSNGMKLHTAILREKPELGARYIVMSGGSADTEVWRWFRSMPLQLQKPFPGRDLLQLLKAIP